MTAHEMQNVQTELAKRHWPVRIREKILPGKQPIQFVLVIT